MKPEQALIDRFLTSVWGRQPSYRKEAQFFLSTKDWNTGTWRDYAQDTLHPEIPIKVPQNGDLYFAPCSFSDTRRLKENALAGRWLYADLDEVDPRELPSHIRPTLAWETSPKRFQAMWLLDRSLNPRRLQDLNQRLTYYTGADKGGWSLTKVLRVPGSVSTKRGRDNAFRVRLLPRTESPAVYSTADLRTLLADVDTGGGGSATNSLGPCPSRQSLPSAADVLKRRKRRIPPKAKQLLRTEFVLESDDRSARLWQLETLLLDAGLPPEEVLALILPTVWNKFKGQRREMKILWMDISRNKANRAERDLRKVEAIHPKPKKKAKAKTKGAKARAKPVNRRKDSPKTGPEHTEFVTFKDFMTKPLAKPDWLVHGIWGKNAVGFLAGEPKTFKTLLIADLAVSIASGTPFLGEFSVPRKGPVFFIQEENDEEDMQDRFMRIAASRGLGPKFHKKTQTIDFGADLGIHILNNKGFSLIDEEWMHWLELRMQRVRPALVAFDPLYKLAPGVDENSASEMTPILVNLSQLKEKFKSGMLVAHHYHKPKESNNGRKTRAATRMSGTGVFHRWYASAIFVERVDESVPKIRLSGEHRSHGSPPSYSVTFDLGEKDNLDYSALVEEWQNDEISQNGVVHDKTAEVIDAVLQAGSEGLPTARVSDVADLLGVTPNAVRSRAKKANLITEVKMVEGRRQSHLLVPEALIPIDEEGTETP